MESIMAKSALVCPSQSEVNARLQRDLPNIVRELVATSLSDGAFAHVNPAPLPSRQAAIKIIDLLRRIIFPGYFEQAPLEPLNLEYRLGQDVTALFQMVADQVSMATRHDCMRYQRSCINCDEKGAFAALEVVRRLPMLRQRLAGDVRAAYDGDPASGSYDEIIFCYPGLYAVMVYRVAHILYHLDVPLLPRIMTEHAHSRTGIDIHPGAHIGGSFFIDHGTGVVIGQTTKIGDRVRIYQGVTLGALSLPQGAVAHLRASKRHPTIEDDVVIYSGATILGGDTVVGARSIIGGNTWITESVPPDTRVLLKAPEQIYLGEKD
jgi:serine O-acetyltransferase